MKIAGKEEIFFPKSNENMRETVTPEQYRTLREIINALLNLSNHKIQKITTNQGIRFDIWPTPDDGLCHWKTLGLAPSSELAMGLIGEFEAEQNACRSQKNKAKKQACRDELSLLMNPIREMFLDHALREGNALSEEEQAQIIFNNQDELAQQWKSYVTKNGGKAEVYGDDREARGRPPVGRIADQFFAHTLGVDLNPISEFIAGNSGSNQWKEGDRVSANSRISSKEKLYLVSKNGGGHIEMAIPVQGPFPKPIILTTLNFVSHTLEKRIEALLKKPQNTEEVEALLDLSDAVKTLIRFVESSNLTDKMLIKSIKNIESLLTQLRGARGKK